MLQFPELYSYPTMGGFGCRDGWYDILFDLSVDIGWLALDLTKFEVVQVKEKFGGLRFYVSHGTKEIEAAIREAEAISYKTCEWCGKEGTGTTDGKWQLTLCPTHKNELGRA